MKNLKKILAAILVIAVMVTAMVPAFAATASYTYKAEAAALHTLGLYPSNTDLGAKLTRGNSIVMALQLFNKTAEVKKISSKTAAADLKKLYKDASKISASIAQYVDYAIQNGLIGESSSFGPTTQITGKEYCSLLLKLMGYALEPADEKIAAALLTEAGGLSVVEAIKFNDKLLTNDSAVGISYAALKSKDFMGVVVAEGMIAEKAFTFEAGIAAGVIKLNQPAAPEGAVFWDDFENGLTKWVNETQFAGPVTDETKDGYGVWDTVVDSGSHVLAQTNQENPFFIMSKEGKDWTNYTVDAKVKPVAIPGGAINLTARYNSPAEKATYYIFQMDKTTLYFKKFSLAGMTNKLTTPFTPVMDKWYDMKMTVSGNTITCFLDGVLIFSVYDQSPIPSGRAGISGWGAQPLIDSFSVVPGAATEIVAAPVPSEVTATNGQVKVTLDKAPSQLPKLADFAITQQIAGVDTAAVAVVPTAVSYDLDKTFTFAVPAIVQTDAAQKVTYSVKYVGGAAKTVDLAIPASTTPRLEGTSKAATYGSLVTVKAVNYAATAVNYQIFKGTAAISDIAALGTATTVYPAAAVGAVVTVKVLAADGTVLDTKDVTLK